MQIYLIRHAVQESILCNDNTPLSEKGRGQAIAVGERLIPYNIQAVYSSDLLRASETATIINHHLENMGIHCPHIIKKELREADFGELTGFTDEQIEREFKDFMESRYHTDADWGYPGGENGRDVWERVEPVFNEILESGYESVAVVTHGGTIRCILSHLFGKGYNERLVFAKRFVRGSITQIQYDKKRNFFSLERFNDYAHLEKATLPDNKTQDSTAPLKKIGRDISLILASGSIRRRQLLEKLNIPFITIKSSKEELLSNNIITPSAMVKELSSIKALDVAEKITDNGSYVILGADTVVVSPGGMILGKPESRDEAVDMIYTLAGHTHSVYTGVTLILWELGQGDITTIDSFYSCTKVTVAPMDLEEIEAYVDNNESMDKAGGYAIQGLFAPYVKRIEGDYYNVVGLPLSDVRLHLRDMGIVM